MLVSDYGHVTRMFLLISQALKPSLSPKQLPTPRRLQTLVTAPDVLVRAYDNVGLLQYPERLENMMS